MTGILAEASLDTGGSANALCRQQSIAALRTGRPAEEESLPDSAATRRVASNGD